jgi:hypothetical protein
MGHFPVVDVIESHGLIHRLLRKNREDRIKNTFCLSAESIVSDSGKKRNQDQSNEKVNPLFHIICSSVSEPFKDRFGAASAAA